MKETEKSNPHSSELDEYMFDTLQLHAGLSPSKDRNARAMPIYMTTSYLFEDTQHAADLFSQKREGYTYSRQKNPTNEVLEKRIAALERGSGAIATASGMSALMLVFTSLAAVGKNIVSSSRLYGGSTIQLKYSLKKLGISTRFITGNHVDDYAAAIDGDTRCIFVESISNPDLNIPDFEALADLAHSHGIPLVVDSTFAGGGYLCRPLDWGADIVVHSATKWIGGHGLALGGLVVEGGAFNWNSEKFPNFSTPSPMNRNIVFWDVYGPPAGKNSVLTSYLRLESLKHLGPALSPFNAFLLLVGLETLSLRMQRHCENAIRLAQFLEQHPKVEWVWFPGLSSHKGHELAKKYFRDGLYGSMLAFGMKGGERAGKNLVERLSLASHLANVGDAKTLVIHPATTTHNQLNAQEMKDAGFSPDLVRVSVGIEHADDIVRDFSQALDSL